MRASFKMCTSIGICLVGGWLFGAFSGLGQAAVAQQPEAKEADTAKLSIKEIMKVGHKDGLLKKILDGDATQEEKQLLLDLYITMFESKPEKGDLQSWQQLAGGSALAAAKVVVGRPDGIETLKVATNCKACHESHK